MPNPSRGGLLRGGGSWGWDSNVFEKMDAKERVEDGFLRLLVEASPEPFRAGKRSLGVRARGLTERYFTYASDSRYQAEGSFQATQQTGRVAAVWLSGRGEFRTYPDSTDRNYRRGSTALGVAAKVRGGELNVAWAVRGLDYRRTSRFDRSAQALTLEVRRPLHPRVDLTATAEFEWSRYGRDAIRDPSVEAEGDARHQKDRGREAQLGIQVMRGWLFEGFAAWEAVRSNSFGYSLGRRSLSAMASGWLPGGVASASEGEDRVRLVPGPRPRGRLHPASGRGSGGGRRQQQPPGPAPPPGAS